MTVNKASGSAPVETEPAEDERMTLTEAVELLDGLEYDKLVQIVGGDVGDQLQRNTLGVAYALAYLHTVRSKEHRTMSLVAFKREHSVKVMSEWFRVEPEDIDPDNPDSATGKD